MNAISKSMSPDSNNIKKFKISINNFDRKKRYLLKHFLLIDTDKIIKKITTTNKIHTINFITNKTDIPFTLKTKLNRKIVSDTNINIEYVNDIEESTKYRMFKQISAKNKDIYNIFDLDQISISQSLIHLKTKICGLYNLVDYYSKTKPLLIFGLYDKNDIEILYNHSSTVYIMWGGSDCLYKDTFVKIVKILQKETTNEIINLCISNDIYKKLQNHNIQNLKSFFFTLCIGDPNLTKKKIKTDANYIFIYDGIGISSKDKSEIYNKNIIDQLSTKIVNTNVKIYRTSKNSFNKNIYNFYENCFLGVRLTKYDGNANTAQELGVLGIPVISNLSMNHCIPWHNLSDVEFKVNYLSKHKLNIPFVWDRLNILLISGDLPYNGGAATHTFLFNKYLNDHGFNSNAIYLNEELKSYNYDNVDMTKDTVLHKKRYYSELMNFVSSQKYDKIILRTSLPAVFIHKLKKNTKKIIFMMPGFFKNNLPFNFLNFSKHNYKKYINISNLSTALNVDEIYVNSKLTKFLVQTMLKNKNTEHLSFNTINQNYSIYKDEKQSNRTNDLIFVTNNLNRDIKNSQLAVEIFKNFPNKHKIIVGKGKITENIKNFTHIQELSNSDLCQLLSDSKIIINTSYFDSFSNIVYEGTQLGCKVLVSQNNGISNLLDAKNIVKSFDIKDWIEKINFLFDDKENIYPKLDKVKWKTEILIQKIISS